MATPIEELRGSLTGDILEPSDREYERARLSFNLLIDRRPTATARCRVLACASYGVHARPS
jgi:hypothetical protein